MPDAQGERWIVAGEDIHEFVEGWLATKVAAEEHKPNSLLLLAVEDPFENDRYFYGMTGTMQCIAPDTWGGAGTRSDLLLFAVPAAYQEALGPGPGKTWTGPRRHVRDAFDYVNEVGEGAAAHTLRRSVGERARRRGEPIEPLEAYWAKRSPGARAEHERKMAEGDTRVLRAAKALDGTDGDPWDSMPTV